jgi:hypothetical protein
LDVKIDPNRAEAVVRLREAAIECGKLIDELDAFDWNPEPYLPGIELPYDEVAIRHFIERARHAGDLQTKLLAIFSGLGTVGKPWENSVKTTLVSEGYPMQDGLMRHAKRPSRTGLDAVRNVINAALLVLGDSIRKPSAVEPRKRGPDPDTENHKQIADIIRRFEPDWRSLDKLEDICEALDNAKLPLPKSWAKWKPRKPHTWMRALQLRQRLVVQALEYRLKMAPLHPS